jgi:MYXO-CTERM domain-containing protein
VHQMNATSPIFAGQNLRRRFVGLTAALCALLCVMIPAVSFACGGFFCSFNRPVNQVGEQILFSVEGTKVTAQIQIQYQGEAENFSWVLPLPAVPDVTVGTDQIFQALRAITDPRFEIDWQNEEGCNFTNSCMMMANAAEDGGGGGEPGAVEILKEGAVGPYNFQVVDSDDGEAMFNWLNENGYDQSPEAKNLIEHYVETDFVFIAIKLSKDSDSGDIRPLIVEYDAPNLACIPLRLTSIAAQADMPIFTWVLSDARAIPINFFHVLLNPKAYNWVSCGVPTGQGNFYSGYNGSGVDCQQEYLNLVTAAVDSAEGRGFVTEFAGASEVMEGAIYTEGQYDVDKLKDLDDPVQFLQMLLQLNFPRNALIQEIIRDNIPQPDPSTLPQDCQTETEFYTWNLEQCLKNMPEDWTFDPAAFVADLEERFITPLKDGQALFTKHPYLTRLFTTMSPDEMTRDPLFAFNGDLGDVSNVHTVIAKAKCATVDDGSPVSWKADSITFTYADGDEITMEGPFEQCANIVMEDSALGGQPAAAEIQVLTETGEAETVAPEDVERRDVELDRVGMTVGTGGTGTGVTPIPSGNPPVAGGTDEEPKKSSGGCTAAHHGMSPWALAFLLLGFFGVLRTRRRTYQV